MLGEYTVDPLTHERVYRAVRDAFQEACQRYKEDYCRAVERVIGLSFERKQAAAALRRKLA
jgi:hypothetical protein